MGYIGMTEAGDAGWDLSWHDKVINSKACLGAILITKAGSNKKFQEQALDLLNHKPVIIHFGVTGWGHTAMERGNLDARSLINSIRSFIDNGFPAKNIVLRIDPVIPTDEGIERAKNVVILAKQTIPDVTRIRISIYDDYHHSREEMCSRGYEPVDNFTKWKNEMERRPSLEVVEKVAEALISVSDPSQIFELCAEPELEQAYPDRFQWFGCLSQKDCDIMGIEVPEGIGINGQNRYGCRCLKMKHELLVNKRRCHNDCAYCYWKCGPAAPVDTPKDPSPIDF